MARTDRRRRGRRAALPAGAIAGLLAAVMVAGCGYSRAPVPSVFVPAPARGYKPLHPSGADFALLAPKNWSFLSEQVTKPVVMIDASGPAVIAVSRYPRTTAPPADAAELSSDLSALVSAIKAKQPGIRVTAQRTLTVSGHPAVQLEADERISGLRRRVISTHVFLTDSELVLEEYAPPQVFPRVAKVFAYVAGHFVVLHHA